MCPFPACTEFSRGHCYVLPDMPTTFTLLVPDVQSALYTSDVDFPIFRTVINQPCRNMWFTFRFGLPDRLWASRLSTSPSDPTSRLRHRLDFLICTDAHRGRLSLPRPLRFQHSFHSVYTMYRKHHA